MQIVRVLTMTSAPGVLEAALLLQVLRDLLYFWCARCRLYYLCRLTLLISGRRSCREIEDHLRHLRLGRFAKSRILAGLLAAFMFDRFDRFVYSLGFRFLLLFVGQK